MGVGVAEMKQRAGLIVAVQPSGEYPAATVLEAAAEPVSDRVRTASSLREMLAAAIIVGFVAGTATGLNLPHGSAAPPAPALAVAVASATPFLTATPFAIPTATPTASPSAAALPTRNLVAQARFGLSTSPTCIQYCATPSPSGRHLVPQEAATPAAPFDGRNAYAVVQNGVPVLRSEK